MGPVRREHTRGGIRTGAGVTRRGRVRPRQAAAARPAGPAPGRKRPGGAGSQAGSRHLGKAREAARRCKAEIAAAGDATWPTRSLWHDRVSVQLAGQEVRADHPDMRPRVQPSRRLETTPDRRVGALLSTGLRLVGRLGYGPKRVSSGPVFLYSGSLRVNIRICIQRARARACRPWWRWRVPAPPAISGPAGGVSKTDHRTGTPSNPPPGALAASATWTLARPDQNAPRLPIRPMRIVLVARTLG